VADGLAGIVLAAGAGTRLRPLTEQLPKALCPVGNRPLVDLALDRLAAVVGDGPGVLAVNAHHHADLVRRHCAGRATVSVEQPEALGTAGGVAALRDWLDGRDVLVTNADAYLSGPLAFTGGWTGERCRLLCTQVEAREDFVDDAGRLLRYVGACLLPWDRVKTLKPEPTGLYEVLWRDSEPEFALFSGAAIDCGSPRDYLAANLHASAGEPVIAPTAEVLGTVERTVVWDGAHVAPDEHLSDVIRAGTRENPVTVPGT
jgi:MurNAc alpha-1-phosphate uridylyltransferase